ncbi:mitochondrial coiled-coil domain protein 1 isoform X2 [Mustela putorius furo]|uniref:Mitochondrial coiled-coil domain protein 1 isoform X2 n=1 Tax=Mustela putorius furo TaxID=9669 RepID=A0A8U0TBQ2_MUSPF|nr:mitochondrial coiled-coil domain protein 1 isoform X2 [Mustela putorius furo]
MLLPSPPPAFLAPGPPGLLEVLLPEPQGKHRRANQLHMQWEAELAQAEELLEQQLELYQALLDGQEGAWEAQALVLKIQKLKEQMRRHRESLGDA